MTNDELKVATGALHVSDALVDFYGGVFSSFAPWPFTYQGIAYPTREHWFQSFKTADQLQSRHITLAPSPQAAKERGRTVLLRRDWEEIKYAVMVQGIQMQVLFHRPFRDALLATNPRLIREDSPSDGIWGWREVKYGRAAGPGLNLLGKALMQVRDQLLEESE